MIYETVQHLKALFLTFLLKWPIFLYYCLLLTIFFPVLKYISFLTHSWGFPWYLSTKNGPYGTIDPQNTAV